MTMKCWSIGVAPYARFADRVLSLTDVGAAAATSTLDEHPCAHAHIQEIEEIELERQQT